MRLFKQFYLIVITLFVPSVILGESCEEPVREVVVINKISYQVPSPWQGHKVTAETLTAPPLVQIPLYLTKNESKLFLLDKACLALIRMARDAEKSGISFEVDSSYRSSWYQKKIFIRMMAEGREFKDIVRYVAPPGYSDHALGTVVDFTPSNWRFAGTPAYSWLKNNAGRFGFFETLPEYSKRKTPWEAWHWKYTAVKE